MNKTLKLLVWIIGFISLALLVFAAGQLVLNERPLIALLPAGLVLFIILLYVRLSEKADQST
jgi:hypothetical protein